VSIDDAFGETATVLQEDVKLLLNGFTHQSVTLDVPSTNTRSYDHYDLEIQKLVDDGDPSEQNLGATTPFTIQFHGNGTQFDAYFRIFPGRESSIAIRLDDSMFVQDVNFQWSFDRDQFILANYSQFGTAPSRMNGFLSDYVMFDLTNLQDTPPDFPDASGTASVLYANGDNFAVGQIPDGPPDQATADPKPFFVLTPIGFIEGLHVGPRTAIDGSGNSIPLPGTYTLLQGDPRPPFDPLARITALQGTYKNYSKTIFSVGSNPQGFEIIAFPSTFTDDPTADDFGKMDIVLLNLVGNQITHMYFGQMDFITNQISAFPIAQIIDPSNTNNEITGTISNFVDGGGNSTSDVDDIRFGRYTLDPTNLPGTFSTSGRFFVYRK
jgi:hypothetical protein